MSHFWQNQKLFAKDVIAQVIISEYVELVMF